MNMLHEIGDIIEWTFDTNRNDQFAGKTYQAKIAHVDMVKGYCVYAEYGQDYVNFNQARLIKEKNPTVGLVKKQNETL